MSAKTKQEVDKRMNKLAKPTAEQLYKLEERIRKHREKHGSLDHQGLFGTISKLFR
jgi:hypothetical protein